MATDFYEIFKYFVLNTERSGECTKSALKYKFSCLHLLDQY